MSPLHGGVVHTKHSGPTCSRGERERRHLPTLYEYSVMLGTELELVISYIKLG